MPSTPPSRRFAGSERRSSSDRARGGSASPNATSPPSGSPAGSDAACEQEPGSGCRRRSLSSDAFERPRPVASPSPSATPTCWCCREEPPSLGSSGARGCRARGRGLACRHGPVRSRLEAVDGRALLAAAGIGFVTTVCCAWRWTIVARGLGAPPLAAGRRRCLLPRSVPQRHPSGRHRRGRPSRRQPRARRARPRPRREGRRVGTRGRPGRAGRADDRRPLDAAVAGALVHAVRGACRGRRRPSRRSYWPRRSGAGSGCGRDPGRSAAPERAAGESCSPRSSRWSAMRPCSSSPRGRRVSMPRSSGSCRWRCSRSWPWCCRASPVGGRARAPRPGCSPRPASGANRRRGDRRRLRRDGAFRQPSRRDRARRRLDSPVGSCSARKERPMRDRPYTLLSCCVSIDGYIGNAASRLLLSNDADFDRVDAVRASCDAILVGAETVRVDNPRLLVRSQTRRDERAARGLPGSPAKVTVTRGRSSMLARTSSGRRRREARLLRHSTAGGRPSAAGGRCDRRRRRRRRGDGHAHQRPRCARCDRLMVEGGGTVHTQFLTEDIVDELQLTVAPFFVGDSDAPQVRRGTASSPGTRAGGRSSSTCDSSATSSSCAMRSRRGSRTA